ESQLQQVRQGSYRSRHRNYLCNTYLAGHLRMLHLALVARCHTVLRTSVLKPSTLFESLKQSLQAVQPLQRFLHLDKVLLFLFVQG
ncbi:MAG: hypothetical protein ACI92B_001351, partial [Marinobacter maritimus]